MPFAYVTGAERGLGFGLVKTLLARGYHVFAGYFLPDIMELKALGNLHPDKLYLLPLDVTNQDSVNRAAAKIRSRTDVLDLLVNNAGRAKDRSETILDDLYFEDMRELMETNAFGTLRVTKSVIELLLQSEGKTIVNISSVAGSMELVTRTQQYGYTISKAAVNMQSKILYNHFHEQGLRVRAIHPGWMRSLLFGDLERMKDAPLEPEESAEMIIDLVLSDKDYGDKIFMDYSGKVLPW